MPFIATCDGERVIPEGVSDGETVQCPDCGETMFPWGPASDGTARHFKHHSRGNDCDAVGGESAVHAKLKSLAVSQLRLEFDALERHGPEIKLDAPTSNGVEYRQADALIEFDNRDPQLGTGLIAEVQYRHFGKDKADVLADYLAQDYAVVWLSEDDFSTDQCLLDADTFRDRAQNVVWPDHVPSRADWEAPFEVPHIGAHQRDVPATMPTEWHRDLERSVWDDRPWEDRFTGESNPVHRALVEWTIEDDVWDHQQSIPATMHLPKWLTDAEELLFVNFEADYPDQHKRDGPTVTERLDHVIEHYGIDTAYENIFTEIEVIFESVTVSAPGEWGTELRPKNRQFRFVPADLYDEYVAVWETNESDTQRGQGEKQPTTYDVEKPVTPFEDVQCHNCGAYTHAPSAGDRCGKCGTAYDWAWNVRTGRIDPESVPESGSLSPTSPE